MTKLPFIDDSAGSYGVASNPEGMSFDTWLRAQSSDVKEAIKNAIKNVAGAMSPIGNSEQGNMRLQVPPMITGIADSYGRLAGTPNNPGNAYNISGVPELDAPLQQDMSNALLSLYGGNAVYPLARRPVGSVGAGMGEAAAQQPIRAYRGSTHAEADPLPYKPYWSSSNPDVASEFAMRDQWPKQSEPNIAPVDVSFKNPLVVSSDKPYDWGSVPFEGDTYWPDTIATIASQRGHDGVILNNIIEGSGNIPATTYAAVQRGTVKSATTGETLFSDTGKPSLFGAAAATAGEQPSIERLKQIIRSRMEGQQ